MSAWLRRRFYGAVTLGWGSKSRPTVREIPASRSLQTNQNKVSQFCLFREAVMGAGVPKNTCCSCREHSWVLSSTFCLYTHFLSLFHGIHELFWPLQCQAHGWCTHIYTGRVLDAHKIQISKSREAGQELCSVTISGHRVRKDSLVLLGSTWFGEISKLLSE